jgi:hypothetical protein
VLSGSHGAELSPLSCIGCAWVSSRQFRVLSAFHSVWTGALLEIPTQLIQQRIARLVHIVPSVLQLASYLLNGYSQGILSKASRNDRALMQALRGF